MSRSGVLAAFGVLPFLMAAYLPCGEAIAESRPNILLIVSDDQTFDDLEGVMPHVEERIFNQGAWFKNAFVTTSSCCPSRASILTGMYASKHEVIGNRYVLLKPTLVEYLRRSGYYTGLVGKYLNTSDGTPRREFDYWVSFEDGSVDYLKPRLNVQGRWQVEDSYSTYAFRDYARQFIKVATQHKNPWILIFAPNAPHSPAIPPPHAKLVEPKGSLAQKPNFAESDLSKKPHGLQEIGTLSKDERAHAMHFRAKQQTCLKALDETVNTILDDLQSAGALDNTLVIYISDNGVLRGEHNLKSKDSAYEEAVRVPLAMRYPARISGGTVNTDHLAANIDLAPTIFDFAKLPPRSEVDGVSLLGILDGRIPPRTSLLLEGWRTKGRVPFMALRTQQFKFIHNLGDIDELYDLNIDPFELTNRVDDPAYTIFRNALSGDLLELVKRIRGTTSFKFPKGTISPKFKEARGIISADDKNYEKDEF